MVKGDAGTHQLNNAGGLPSSPLPAVDTKGLPMSPVCEHPVP